MTACWLCREDVDLAPTLEYEGARQLSRCPSCTVLEYPDGSPAPVQREGYLKFHACSTIALARAFDRNTEAQERLLDVSRKQLAALNRDAH